MLHFHSSLLYRVDRGLYYFSEASAFLTWIDLFIINEIINLRDFWPVLV